MSEVAVKFEIPPELVKALGTDLRTKVIQPAAMAWAKQTKRILVEYPPENVGNRPNLGRWYQRGYGPRWKRKDGSIGGMKTSQMLSRKWALVQETWGALVGSPVTYAHWVHSSKEQAAVHKRHGWKTDERAVTEAKPKFDEIMNQLMKALGLG
jgi:hypothetical protein